MKVKIVVFLLSMLLLASCWGKKTEETPSWDENAQEIEQGINDNSSTIGGWQWTPAKERTIFRN